MERHQRAGPELSARELHDILQLRVSVFVVEQACPYPELDGHDLEPTTEHRWLADSDGIASYIRTLPEADGSLRIGRVVTRPDVRGRALSADLIRIVLADHPGVATVLAAQSQLRTFYERLGYVLAGTPFVEDGIPHLPMRRPASPAPDDGSDRLCDGAR